MTDTKYTPGPWIVEKSGSSATGSVHYAVKTTYKPTEHPWSPRFIVFMCGGLGDYLPHRPMNDYRDDPQIEADVNLIAAAPDLIEALVSARFAIQVALDGGQVSERNVRSTLNQIDAAIAKAEGRHD